MSAPVCEVCIKARAAVFSLTDIILYRTENQRTVWLESWCEIPAILIRLKYGPFSWRRLLLVLLCLECSCACEGFILVLLAGSHQDSLGTFPTDVPHRSQFGKSTQVKAYWPPVTLYPLTTHSWKNPSDTAVFVSGGQIAFRCHNSVLWGRGSKRSGQALWWLDGVWGNTCQITMISQVCFNLPNIKWWKRGNLRILQDHKHRSAYEDDPKINDPSNSVHKRDLSSIPNKVGRLLFWSASAEGPERNAEEKICLFLIRGLLPVIGLQPALFTWPAPSASL